MCGLSALIERLQGASHSAVGAHSGSEALDLIAAALRRPSLILFNLSTSVVEGRDFCERQRNDPGLARIPVILISATVAIVSGDTRSLLTKPVDIGGLLALVGQIADAPQPSTASLKADLIRAARRC